MKIYIVHDQTDSELARLQAVDEASAVAAYNSTAKAAHAVWAEQVINRDDVDPQYMPDIDDPALLRAEQILLDAEAKAMHWKH